MCWSCVLVLKVVDGESKVVVNGWGMVRDCV